nr:reverse transcriptase domain-containing protein [Tanacetum cinerariifolium]
MKLMTEMYCPLNEIYKMEIELWNLTVKGNDLTTYIHRIQDLTMLCIKMVLEEDDRVEKFIGGLSDNIQRNMIATEPMRLQDAIRIANNLMNQKLKGYVAKSVEKKKSLDFNQKDNRAQQPLYKRQKVGGQNVARAYTAGNNERKEYARPWPYYNKYKLHHEGQCTVRCSKCKKVRHMVRNCKVVVAKTTRGSPEPNQKVDRSFVSTIFSALLDAIPSILDVSYVVELVDGRIAKTNTVLRGCTLGLLGHPFNMDLMPVELGSFKVIIGMDWVANHHALIICDEKIVRTPYEDEVLIVRDERSGKGKKSKLSNISCTKTQKYIKKGCLVFLAQVTKKETEDKSEEKRLEDLPMIRDFLEVFPEDLPGLPSMRKVEFQIDLDPGASLVARAPYRLAPSKLQELSTQLDYAGASLDKKSTIGGCHFLGSRLMSWQCKKQTIVANSTTEVEYIATSNYCGQVLWLQNQLLDYGYNFMHTKIHVDNKSATCVVKNHVYHLKTKHIEIRHHFIRKSGKNKLIEMVKIHNDYNVADLLTKAFDMTRF